eukprot:TRINITY_DN7668_c3_g1_i1.p4 TRINITY_DN7668_c3_g1~~TRINITY_DN7668_c3_g1_i1.p4  ORF type:complete len:101 (-),score=0.74 TRINITY_DN7668_c3_g1_i1:147-449(-)
MLQRAQLEPFQKEGTFLYPIFFSVIINSSPPQRIVRNGIVIKFLLHTFIIKGCNLTLLYYYQFSKQQNTKSQPQVQKVSMIEGCKNRQSNIKVLVDKLPC